MGLLVGVSIHLQFNWGVLAAAGVIEAAELYTFNAVAVPLPEPQIGSCGNSHHWLLGSHAKQQLCMSIQDDQHMLVSKRSSGSRWPHS